MTNAERIKRRQYLAQLEAEENARQDETKALLEDMRREARIAELEEKLGKTVETGRKKS